MTAAEGGGDGHTRHVGEVLRLAWPLSLSFLLTNAYRINDQFWIQGLGEHAQTAIGATFYVIIMNFALMFLAVGGTLALVSRATGAEDPQTRDSVARHAMLLAIAIGATLAFAVRPFTPEIVALLGLPDAAATLAEDYLGTIYLFSIPLALTPAVDNIFIGRGHTRIPMVLQFCAVGLNFALNPFLIYGVDSLGFDGWGIRGAAVATGLSRTVAVTAGVAILRIGFGTSLVGSARPSLSRLFSIARISAPSSVSIAVYAGVYWAMLGLVLSRLDGSVTAGLGIGFQVFEGAAFPCYLGVSIAGASLVGRALGARDPDAAWSVVRATRLAGRVLGLSWAVVFLGAAPFVVGRFTAAPEVAAQTLLYVRVLAFSQYQVAVESVNERVLIGSGHTRPILWISTLGNLLRVPLAWLFALVFGWAGAGVWWAINVTTWLKAGFLWREVQRGEWLAGPPTGARKRFPPARSG